MSESGGDREALRARLEWLRLLGVENLAGRRESSVRAVPSETTIDRSGPGAEQLDPKAAGAPVVQDSLFGAPEVVEERPVSRRRGAEKRSPSQPPLASMEAPAAPDAASALQLIQEQIGDCRRCRLCERRTHIVFGVGNPQARLMFIGEGPGVDEDRQGEPFVGRAGQLLTRIIESMGLARPEVYIANVVKCRPPDNRTPLPDEVGTCSPFLFQQVAAIRPEVIVCLGTPAAQTVLGTREPISRLRGSFHESGGFRVMPTFHPAYLLRNPAAKKQVWEDMKKVMAQLKTRE